MKRRVITLSFVVLLRQDSKSENARVAESTHRVLEKEYCPNEERCTSDREDNWVTIGDQS